MEFNDVVTALTGLNLHTLFFFLLSMWWFTKDIRADVKSMKDELHASNTRVSRIEGTVYGRKLYED